MAQEDLNTMDEVSRKRFEELTHRDPVSLTAEEKDFLFARRGYMNKSQREEYKDLIAEGDARVAAANEK